MQYYILYILYKSLHTLFSMKFYGSLFSQILKLNDFLIFDFMEEKIKFRIHESSRI